jgi:hypothetical protein
MAELAKVQENYVDVVVCGGEPKPGRCRMAGPARSLAPMTPAAHFIGLPEFAERVGMSKASAYSAARAGEVGGAMKIGRLLGSNWSAFVATTYPEGVEPRRAAERDTSPGSRTTLW